MSLAFWSALAQLARLLGELAARHLPPSVEQRTIIDDLRDTYEGSKRYRPTRIS